jgi:hypothetical protein
MRVKHWVEVAGAVPLVAGLLVSCGDDESSAVPIDSIPPDKQLIALSPEEQEGVCQWAGDVARDKLSSGGAPLTCHGNAITLSTCNFPTSAQVRCTATIGEWRACLPNFLDAIAADPCQVLSLAFSQTALEDFVNGIPGCEGQGPCAYTVQQ